jgi:hypothetical protein
MSSPPKRVRAPYRKDVILHNVRPSVCTPKCFLAPRLLRLDMKIAARGFIAYVLRPCMDHFSA